VTKLVPKLALKLVPEPVPQLVMELVPELVSKFVPERLPELVPKKKDLWAVVLMERGCLLAVWNPFHACPDWLQLGRARRSPAAAESRKGLAPGCQRYLLDLCRWRTRAAPPVAMALENWSSSAALPEHFPPVVSVRAARSAKNSAATPRRLAVDCPRIVLARPVRQRLAAARMLRRPRALCSRWRRMS
jgi:hypothetical protein